MVYKKAVIIEREKWLKNLRKTNKKTSCFNILQLFITLAYGWKTILPPFFKLTPFNYVSLKSHHAQKISSTITPRLAEFGGKYLWVKLDLGLLQQLNLAASKQRPRWQVSQRSESWGILRSSSLVSML